MWIEYFNDQWLRAGSFGIMSQIKIMKEPLLVFIGLRFCIYLVLYKIMSWKKKEFKDIEDLLVSFILYFIIVKDTSCISTMYSYLLL
jgi:hypothetical protein